MRSGGYSVHHSLTVEAAAIVKQAVNLGRRRGHSQVTPLHVASAMLNASSSPTALLKMACLQSHSHPLQCKALDLCFNVALNRLPTSPHSHHLPSLSNALVAAFKRAQAHQRRGSIESQQQPILALKVDIHQLLISILDDPSVSRVMREAGFSSTQVKNNVITPMISAHFRPSSTKAAVKKNIKKDVVSVLEAMMSKKSSNIVVLGECGSTNETIIRGVIEKFDKKEVPPDMKSVQFISVPLFTLNNVSKEEFEVKLGELRSLVKSYVSKGVVLYLGDLDWVSDFWSKFGEQRSLFFCAVEYMIMELSRLICGNNAENKRLWIMGFATFQGYAKCKIGRPSLETLWSLNPLTIPVSTSLALTLSLDHCGMHEDQVKKEVVDDYNAGLFGIIKKQLICCSDCSENFKKEAEAIINGEKELISSSSSSRLPSWLQQYKDENRKQVINANQESSDKIKDLCKKWNSICTSVHRKPHFLEKVFNISSSSPSSSTSVSSNDDNKSKLHKISLLNSIFEHENKGEVSKPELLSNPNSSPNSASSSEQVMEFPRNLEILTDALEKKVPWQRHIIPEIITTILKCRSREGDQREESWLFFLGADYDGKEIIAKEIAKAVFGSHESFVAIGISSFDSAEEVSCINSTNKRSRNEHGGSVFDRFLDAVRCDPSRVFYVEDVDQIDYRCLKSFERAIKDGSVRDGDGEVVPLKDAIVVFSCENFMRSCAGKSEKEERENGGVLDLNIATENDDDGINSDSGVGILDLVDKLVVFKVNSSSVVN